MRIKATCKICGAEYIKTNGKSMYCSVECKKEAARRRYQKNKEKRLAQMRAWKSANPNYQKEWAEKHPNYARDRSRKKRGTVIYERVCVVCGKPFTTPFPYAITCSKECSRKRKAARRKTPEQEHEKYIRRKYGSKAGYQKYLEAVKQKKNRSAGNELSERRKKKKHGRYMAHVVFVASRLRRSIQNRKRVAKNAVVNYKMLVRINVFLKSRS